MAAAFNAKHLTTHPIPALRVSPDPDDHTTRPSDSRQRFEGTAGQWQDFENSVRKTFHQEINWNAGGALPLAYRQPREMSENQVVCANEIGVVGRFHEHIGQVMTCVGRDVGMQLRFGDWYRPGAGGKADVTICVTRQGWRASVAGEVKTPWTIGLQEMMDDADRNPTGFLRDFGRRIGQVAAYMRRGSYRYGFLTTYNETIFVKQDVLDPATAASHGIRYQPNQRVLWYSNVIRHDTPSSGLDRYNPSQSYKGQVSLRECMLYIMKEVDTNGGYASAGGYDKWTQQKSSVRPTFLKPLSPSPKGHNSSTSGSAIAPSRSTAYSSTGQQKQHYSGAYNDRNTSNAQQPQYSRSAYDSYNTSSTQQQQYSRVGDSLAAKMSGLQLQGQRSTNSSKTSQNVVTVKWSDRQQAYYWCKDGVSAHKAVDTHSRKNGKLWVSMSGTWYPANEIRVR